MWRPYSEVEPGQVEHLDLDALRPRSAVAGDLDEPPALRHLAGAGVLAARRGVDDQHPGRPGGRVARRGGADGVARRDPVDRQVVVRIGMAGPGLAGDRALAAVGIGRPGHRGEPRRSRRRAARTPDRRSARRKRARNAASSSRGLGIPLRGVGAGLSDDALAMLPPVHAESADSAAPGRRARSGGPSRRRTRRTPRRPAAGWCGAARCRGARA